MDIIIDACSIINLVNGECLNKVLKLGHKFYIGEMLLEQEILDEAQKIMIEVLIQKKYLKILPSTVSLNDLLESKKKFNLGLGETECILLCKTKGYLICTDDRKAKLCSCTEIGQNNVIGSMFLLKASVKANVMECLEAISSYELMISRGGFLPRNLSKSYFCED